jgi:phosphohistidine phosphatase SixA
MNIHLYRHFAANPDVPGIVPGKDGNLARHLDYDKALEQALKAQSGLRTEQANITFTMYSPAQRTHATLALISIGVACSDTPKVMVPELFPSDTQMPLIEAAFKANKTNVSQYALEAIAACDEFGQKAAIAILRTMNKYGGVYEGDVLVVGHAPTIQFAAMHLAGNRTEDRALVLATSMGEGDRFILSDETGSNQLRFQPLG